MKHQNVWPTLTCDADGFFTVQAGERTWQQDRAYRPAVRTGSGDLYFDEAPQREVRPWRTGTGEGWLATYGGYPDGSSFETICLVETATGRLHCTFVARSLKDVTRVEWPAPFMADEPGSYAVLTNLQGYLLPTDWPQEMPGLPFAGQMSSCSAYMPWWGEVTPQGGYLCHVEAPWDTAYEPRHPAGGPTRIIVKHLPSLGRMEGQRTVTYLFTPAGSGYVDLCRLYRGLAEEKGLAVTLKEKAQRCAKVDELIGASVLHVGTKVNVVPDSAYYNKEEPEKNRRLNTFAERVQLVEDLTRAGSPKMYLHLDGWGEPGYDNQHPDYLPACEAAGGYEGLKALIDTCRRNGHLFGLHDQYRDYYLDAPTYDPDMGVTLADGTLFEMARWAGGKQNYLCTALAPEYVRRNYEELKRNGVDIDAVYLDVFTCNEPDECINPRHRVTRKESLEYRLRCFDYMLKNGIVPSSEEAADWALPSLVFCHWAPYAKNGLPVPLFNLVYHDCFLIPWMTGKGAWGTPEGQLGFLHALLNAGMGYVEDKLSGEELQQNLERLKVLSRLQQRLAHQPMTSHRFVSEDRAQQETSFADGTTVWVDFTTETYRIDPPLSD